jgi:hypothetical protein
MGQGRSDISSKVRQLQQGAAAVGDLGGLEGGVEVYNLAPSKTDVPLSHTIEIVAVIMNVQGAPAVQVRSLGAFIPTTTFMREITPLLQIRKFAQLRSTTCRLQG